MGLISGAGGEGGGKKGGGLLWDIFFCLDLSAYKWLRL